jgi:metal-responsive CopG/Arc/MetJ family transcriptional regulator
MKSKITRTIFSIPKELLEETDRLVCSGKTKSRNEFIAEALASHLAAIEKAEIDAAFAEMAQDREYQREALQIEAEFATASWETLKLGET